MTARDTYHTSVVAAVSTQVASKHANNITAQGSIEGATTASGNPPGRGLTSSQITTVNNAIKALVAANQAAAMAQQVAIDIAKDALRNTGDNAPA